MLSALDESAKPPATSTQTRLPGYHCVTINIWENVSTPNLSGLLRLFLSTAERRSSRSYHGSDAIADGKEQDRAHGMAATNATNRRSVIDLNHYYPSSWHSLLRSTRMRRCKNSQCPLLADDGLAFLDRYFLGPLLFGSVRGCPVDARFHVW